MASTMNVKENNDKLEKLLEQKDELIKEYKEIIVHQNEKIKRKDVKIEELKKVGEKKK